MVHYKAANNSDADHTRFVAVILGRKGESPMTLTTAAELAARPGRRRGDATVRG